jgi:hypothetical protein
MEANRLLQIVSGFKPDSDGMGDFSRLLGDALWRSNGIQSHYAVYRTPRSPLSTEEIAPNTISYAEHPDPETFLRDILRVSGEGNFSHALLHYGPYAYSRDGKPAHFAETILELAKTMRVLVFFHETYAIGKPWKRAFWTGGEQRRALAMLLSCMEAGFTSTSPYMQRLQELSAESSSLHRVRIFSNVGEPDHLKPLNERARRLVVFGRISTRLDLYRNHAQTLAQICTMLGIESVEDAGAGDDAAIPPSIGSAAVKKHGWMSESLLSNLLADSVAGVVAYSPDYWDKSGVLAAYAAHGIVPILVQEDRWHEQEPDALPFVTVDELAHISGPGSIIEPAKLASIADNAHRYYIENQSVDCCVQTILPYLRQK